MAKVICKIGDDISTDVIYPGRYMATVLPTETPQFAFADDTALNGKLKSHQIPRGSVLLAGENFGCGASWEQAVSSLKGHELIIVAKSFARIFLHNAINLGLRTVVCPTIMAEEGDELKIGDAGVTNKTTGKTFPIMPLPASRQAILDVGGLIAYTRTRLSQTNTPPDGLPAFQ